MVLYLSAVALSEPANAPRGTVGVSAQRGHSVLFHRPADLSDWLLYDQSSPNSVDSLVLASGQMFNRNGDLVCTVEQETYFPPSADGGPLRYSMTDHLPELSQSPPVADSVPRQLPL